MNTATRNPSRVVIINIKVIPATNTKGTRMKVSHGDKLSPFTIDYHSVNGFEEAARKYMMARYNVVEAPILANWSFTGKHTAAVALVY